MGATGIEWTIGPNGEPGFTFNPWIGCTKISSACDNCYAETASIKMDVIWGPHGARRAISDATWDAPKAWNRRAAREGRRFRVFCASMADVLDNHHSIDDRWRSWLYELILNTPHLDWLLLTKRPENASKFLPEPWFKGKWPQNVWFGATAENQPRFDHVAQHLRQIPAPVRFLSVEPMLGRIILPFDANQFVDWIIVGGESGKLADIRDTAPEIMRLLVGQSMAMQIPVFVKQMPQLSFRRDYKRFERFPVPVRVRQHPTPRIAA